ncbi:MAG: YdcF family protein [Gemmatimonadaceae bacterium]|jgi:uncharacterized SAM-binding protein YcdF (DUF218 family)|nr:YdcF family protein [Gemmatimonadaceae bacterium]
MTLRQGPVPLPPSTRATPRWLPAAAGAALALGACELALEIGLHDATGVSPAHLRLAALALGAALGRSRFAWTLWLALLASAALLVLIGFTPLVDRAVLSLVRADAERDGADAIVVYSGGMTDAGHIGEGALSRLVSALDDVQRLRVPHVVVSEQTREVRGRTVRSSNDQQRVVGLLGAGVEVHVVGPVYTTHDESLAFAALARARGWTHLRAVTSPLHARRACATLEATGLTVTCAPSTARDVAVAPPSTSGARLQLWRAAVHELVGLFVYRLRGWVS